MKAELLRNGVMQITAQNEIESFALSQWKKSKVEIHLRDWEAQSVEEMKKFANLVEARHEDYKAFLAARDLTHALEEKELANIEQNPQDARKE
jgi:hypothetical protein